MPPPTIVTSKVSMTAESSHIVAHAGPGARPSMQFCIAARRRIFCNDRFLSRRSCSGRIAEERTMWKRENEPVPPPTTAAAPPIAARTERSERPEPEAAPVHRAAESASRAVIGASLDLQGELSGNEDLLIEGRVQGRIQLAQNAVTIGAKGRVSAQVLARLISIEGEVDGNLVAEELIMLKKSARVRGDLVAPRVVIEDGARFKGTIDMDPAKPAQAAGPRPLQAPLPDATASAAKSAPPAVGAPATGTGGSKVS
jgi:cytoskeletal protein CcmA (bactofilin family)